MKKIYLTFDDGIEDGSREVINLLNENNVKATFFLTGVNVFNQYVNFNSHLKDCFSQLIQGNHVVCNHSFSHAFDFYNSYYTKGLLFKSPKRISPCRDFLFNKEFIKWILYKLEIVGLNHRLEIIRLPGRNTFNHSDISSIRVDFLKELIDEKFRIIGWHDEWRMSFDFSEERRRLRNNNNTNLEDFYPTINMQKKENIIKDRCKEKYDELISRILLSNNSDNIILLHDRAFREENSNFNSYLLELSRFINEINYHEIKFETIDNYLK